MGSSALSVVVAADCCYLLLVAWQQFPVPLPLVATDHTARGNQNLGCYGGPQSSLIGAFQSLDYGVFVEPLEGCGSYVLLQIYHDIAYYYGVVY